MATPFFTIGHSTRPLEEFAALLNGAGVRLVADVRSIPRSRTNPQYNRDVLPAALERYRIGYEHIAALGGRRGRQRGVADEVNGFWQHPSFHHYADYALGADFQGGLAHLRELGHATPSAVMCAEAVWWRCHRRIIADYLLAAGETVLHILGPNHIEPAHLTAAARPQPGGTLVYPAQIG